MVREPMQREFRREETDDLPAVGEGRPQRAPLPVTVPWIVAGVAGLGLLGTLLWAILASGKADALARENAALTASLEQRPAAVTGPEGTAPGLAKDLEAARARAASLKSDLADREAQIRDLIAQREALQQALAEARAAPAAGGRRDELAGLPAKPGPGEGTTTESRESSVTAPLPPPPPLPVVADRTLNNPVAREATATAEAQKPAAATPVAQKPAGPAPSPRARPGGRGSRSTPEELQQQLGIDAEKAAQVSQILQKASEERRALWQPGGGAAGGGDRQQLAAKMQEIRDQADAEIAQLLTPEELTKYKAMQQQGHSNRGGAVGQPGGGRGGRGGTGGRGGRGGGGAGGGN